MSKKNFYKEKELEKNSIFKECGKFVELNGTKTYIIEKGYGKNIIFINGIAAPSYTWRGVFNILYHSFHVYCIDFKGTGFSEKPKGEYSITVFSKQVLALMNYFQMKNAVIVANSLGGEIALDFTVKYPYRVEKLVLIDSAGYQKNKKLTSFLVKLSRFALLGKVIDKCITRKNVKRVIRWAISNEDIIDDEMVDAYYSPLKTEGGTGSFLSLVKNLSYTEFKFDILKKVTLPVLIIWGKEDKWIPVSDAYKFHDDIANSKLVILENCGHGPQEEYPEKVSELIEEFIKEN